jgi:hypothetical protein
MDLEKIKEWVLNSVDSIAKSLGVKMRVLVLIAFLVGYLIGRFYFYATRSVLLFSRTLQKEIDSCTLF